MPLSHGISDGGQPAEYYRRARSKIMTCVTAWVTVTSRPYDHVGACGDGYSCDTFRVRCADPGPTCADGEVPAVIAGCWGPCVPVTMCRCEQHWQCPQRDRYRCFTLPEFHVVQFRPHRTRA